MQNKYEVIGIVGEGAYGIVYKCKNKETEEYVAIKKFKETQDDIVKKTMARELRVLQLLKNEYIVEYKGAFKRKENLFLVFEYVDRNLLELLQEHPRGLDPNLIKKIIFQLCKAINYLHDNNIVHRDIKPENLLVDNTNRLKLCDFGFARSLKTNKDNLTDYVATRWYRSPELLITSGVYGPEVDNWAIGCIMGELTDGDPLFPGDNEVDQLIVIQKVIGKLPDEQYEQFSKNPHYSGYKLPEISKPETLERRYTGKLSKQAINFMKQLLNPDPKARLKGPAMLKHPYFEGYAEAAPEQAQSTDNPPLESTKKANSNKQKPGASNPPAQNPLTKKNSMPGNQPIVANTTNINIINYNNYENKEMTAKLEKFDKLEKMEKEKSRKFVQTLNNFNPPNYLQYNDHSLPKTKSKKNFTSQEGLIMTSSGFNKNMKENILALYGAMNYDKSFKTFYKGDKYNYDIDLNFRKYHNSNSEEKRQFNNPSLNPKKEDKHKNKKMIQEKFTPQNIIIEEGAQGSQMYLHSNKVSPPKYTYSQFKNKNYNYQQSLQLPHISGRNFIHKKNSYK